MRIIAGRWRGRKLEAPRGEATRPTSDRARETLFSMLTSRIGSFDDLRVADIFAGTGALGLEALSRGAKHCSFVEQDRPALEALRKNIAALDARGEVLARSVLAIPRVERPYDLLLLDPPYKSDLLHPAIATLTAHGWIGRASWIAIETARDEQLDSIDLTLEADRVIGKARVTIFHGSG